ncbi:MAG TPA: hypothetical protein VFS48_02810 [Solirubrobacterales bacterium]|nr:hypothetical protein [Solirubrobacterales bacterium]
MSIYQRDPAAPGANIRRRQLEAPGSRLERAVGSFNESPAGRTVVGLTRSLGRPTVSVGAAAGSSCEVRITVAWELCWYQWAVDQAGHVAEIAKGEDIEQLDRSARHWNAGVGTGGQLRFGAAGRQSVRRAFWSMRR